MNKFTREDILILLKLMIFIALIIIAIKFFIKLLPIIIVLLIAMIIYDSIKRNKNIVKKENHNDDGIVEAEIIKERKNK